jgi:DNA-binding response OmpR family regulator
MSAPESEPGAGTPSEILLQRADETAGPDSTHEHAPGTLLLVEDDVFLRSTYRELLASQGWEILVAPDGFNALLQANAHKGRIDLLICDVILPQMSGIELWRKLSRLRPEAAVLFISGDLEQARKLLDHEDPPHLLAKPFTPTALLDTVRLLLAESPFLRKEPPAHP